MSNICRCEYSTRRPWNNVTELEDANCGRKIVRTRGYHEHLLAAGKQVSNWQQQPMMGCNAEHHWA